MNVMVTGHRPPKIGGYDVNNPQRARIRDALRAHLLELGPAKIKAVSGMALGVDQDFAAICVDLGIPFVAAVPFHGQDRTWPAAAQKAYQELLARAHEVVVVTNTSEYKPTLLQARNQWMVDWTGFDGVVLAVWDGSRGGTANCVDYAKRQGAKIIRIDPRDY